MSLTVQTGITTVIAETPLPKMSSTTVRPGLVERTTTLSIITLMTFLGNLLLLVTIGQSAALRRTHFNKHIVNVAILNLLTSIVGLPMVIGYSVTSSWDYGEEITCKVFAHFLLTTTICMCLSILAMNIDRVVAIINPGLYPIRMSSVRTAFLIVTVWIVAILFPLPLSLSIVPTTPYSARYVCTISGQSTLKYLIPLYSLCFGFPALLNILIFIYITREALGEKEAESRGTASRPGSTVRLWPEVQTAGVVFILFLAWMISELPYITLTSIEQYIGSTEVDQQFIYSPDLDTTFMWLKFCDSFALPFVIFKWRKDIWSKFKDLIFCRKSNSVGNPSLRQDKRSNNKHKSKPQTQLNKVDAPKFLASFPIPTIKASKDGLHVHGNNDDNDDNEAEGEIFYADLDITGDLNQGKTTVEVENHANPRDMEMEDTSDYETDPYAQSDPISVRSSVSAGQHVRTHSNSTNSAGKEYRTKINSVSVVSQDSGNGSAPSSVKKKRRNKRAVADMYIEDQNDQVISYTQVGEVIQSAESSHTASHTDDLTEAATKHSHEPKTIDSSHKMTADAFDVIETLESEVTKPTKRKKKKKKKNRNIIDAETNTSQVFNMELVERKIPPPRLSPIDPGVIQKSMNSMATPPLRGKVPRGHDSELPPTGLSKEKKKRRRSSNDDQIEEIPPSTVKDTKSRKKKSSRPRNQSGDSEKPLMSSNASSELPAVAIERYEESCI